MYTFEQLMQPVWKADVIYDEALTFVKEDGVAKAPLLFEPDHSDLFQTQEFPVFHRRPLTAE